MTVKDFLFVLDSQAPADRLVQLETVEIWSEQAVKGYVIAAGEAAGLSDPQISRLVDALSAAFDNMTIADASVYFVNGDY